MNLEERLWPEELPELITLTEDVLLAMKLEISPVWVVSSAHLHKRTAEEMSKKWDNGATYDIIEYGYLVWCRNENPNQIEPYELRRIIEIGKALGVRWIKFDQDAEIIEDIPHWDWEEEDDD